MALDVVRFSIVEYNFARQLQKDFVARRSKGEICDSLILCQHYPVITLGKRLSLQASDSLISSRLQEHYPVIATDRGGLVTVHNPGQMIIYPVVSLRERFVGVREFVQQGLGVIVTVLQSFNLDAYYLKDPAGVFVDISGRKKKIGYVGLKICHGISDHGFSVNINNDLSVFDEISSCGLPVGEVVSLQQLVDKESNWREFSVRIEAAFCKLFSN